MKHPNLLDLLPNAQAPEDRWPRKAHIGGRVGVGFAGGGGSSLGLKAAGLKIDFAMNHDAAAIAMHSANCPEAHHYCQDIWQVRPEDPFPGEPIRFMWFSPDCKHFSKAKGGQPVEKKIRDLAWVIVLWAKVRRPDVICMENVEEFMDWGPLMADPKRPGNMVPDPARKGEYFRAFGDEFRKLGYYYGFVKERAWKFGIPALPAAPTIRLRMFGQFRCDGYPITWPEPTHGHPDDADVRSGKLLPWRTIAECIDWTRPCPSIFLTREEARKVRAQRPLQDATMARITLGLQRYVLEAEKPFIVPITHSGPPRIHDTDEPGRTQTCANRGEHALVVPHLSTMRNADKPFNGADEPGATDTSGGANRAVVAAHITKFHGTNDGAPMDVPAPTMTANSYDKRPGCAAPVGLAEAYLMRNNHGEKPADPADEPGRTLTTQGNHLNIVEAFVTGCGGRAGQSPPRAADAPAATATTKPDEIVVQAFVTSQYGNSVGASPEGPGGTEVQVNKHGVVAATLIQTGFGEREGQEPRALDIHAPVGTQMAQGAKHAPVAVYLAQHNGGKIGHGADEPSSTLMSSGGHQQPVAAFMAQHNGGMIGHEMPKPLSTLTGVGSQQQLVGANLLHLRGGGDRFGNSAESPGPTDTAGGQHLGVASYYLVKYYGAAEHGQPVDEPAHTDTPKPRFALARVDMTALGLTEEQRYTAWWVARMIDLWGHPDGLPARGRRKRRDTGSLVRRSLCQQVDLALTPRPSAVGTRDRFIVYDIGMRMLTVRERFRAQGVPDSFITDVDYVDPATGRTKRITETKQGEMCGNMVCPPHAAAIVRAALPELSQPQGEEREAA